MSPSVQTGFLGGTFDCSSLLQYAFSPSCWQYSLGAWQQMNAIDTAAGPMPLPSPPSYVAPNQADLGASAIDAAIAAGKTQTTANLQDYFGQAAQSIQNAPNLQSGPGVWFWVALALGALALIDLTKVR